VGKIVRGVKAKCRDEGAGERGERDGLSQYAEGMQKEGDVRVAGSSWN